MSGQLTLSLDQRVDVNLAKMAKERGVSKTTYATMLFDAAYAARCGFNPDVDLKAKVELLLLLHGARDDTNSIAKKTGLTEMTVMRIMATWRQALSTRPKPAKAKTEAT